MTNKRSSDEYRAAVQAAADADRFGPRAKSARYDRRRRRIVVELTSGATFLFPPDMAQELAGASARKPAGAVLRRPASCTSKARMPALSSSLRRAGGLLSWWLRPIVVAMSQEEGRLRAAHGRPMRMNGAQ